MPVSLSSAPAPRFLPKKFLVLAVLGMLTVASSASSVYFYRQWSQLKKDPQKQLQQEADALIARVSALMVLPSDEKPTIATVTDPEKLKDQPFFATAKSGYKVLIYSNAKKAILYDPVSNKIVDVAPINLGNNPTANSAKSATSSETVAARTSN